MNPTGNVVACSRSGVSKTASASWWRKSRRLSTCVLAKSRGCTARIRLERAIEARLRVESRIERDLQQIPLAREIGQLGSHCLHSQSVHEFVEALTESFVQHTGKRSR